MKKIKSTLKYLWGHKKLSIILIIILGIVSYFLLPKPPAELETATVKKSKITQSITASGKIESESTVNLSFISGGKLVYVGAKNGDTVTAGQTIATLDQRTLKTNLEQSLEDYAIQQNEYEEVQEDNLNHTPVDALNAEMKRVLEDNQNNLDKAKNSVELQQLAVENSVLVTPINGLVIRADAKVPGVNITAATTFTIADPDNLVFSMDVDEADIGRISVGQSINVVFDAFPQDNVSLSVSSIDFASHTSDLGATVYTVKASLPVNQNYRIGMNGDADIIIAEKENVNIIPLSSLIDDQHIYLKVEKTFEKRKITTGLQSDTDIEVVDGLHTGEEVALIPEEVEKILKNN